MIKSISDNNCSIFDSLSQVTQDEDRGITYPAMSVADDIFIDKNVREELEKRTLGMNPQRVVYPILASQTLNSQIAVAFRTSLQKRMWRFLLGEGEAEEFLTKTNKEFLNDPNDSGAYTYFLSPYVNTTFLIGECINLDMSLVSGMIKLTEKPGTYKDRYSAISYGNYVISHFDKNLIKEEDETDEWSMLQSITMFV